MKSKVKSFIKFSRKVIAIETFFPSIGCLEVKVKKTKYEKCRSYKGNLRILFLDYYQTHFSWPA